MNQATRIVFYGMTLMILGVWMSIDYPQGPGWGSLGLVVALIGSFIGALGVLMKDA